ncbi:hypothetical protein QZH41_014587 [Actinostola sp. cb2023]|nr:hypothetical protein QZH41_014587 [Actinostola sp. cb2023]
MQGRSNLSTPTRPGVKISLELISFKNPKNMDLNGKCCDPTPLSCSTCDYYFKICLKDAASGKCVLDIQTKRWDNTNDIVFNKGIKQLGNYHNNPLVKELPSWKGSLKVSIVVMDYDSLSPADLVDTYLIDRWVTPTAGVLQQTWTSLSVKGIPSTLKLKYSIQCNRDYYGPNCTKYCIPRDNNQGHYTCDLKTGQIVCRNGWYGNGCLKYCVPQNDDVLGHYTCDKNTGQKLCHVGWYGASCTAFCKARNDSQAGYTCDSNGNRICLTSWYPSNQCDVFCEARNDSTSGYICDLTTGQKTCLSGWSGPECDCKPRNDSIASFICNTTTGERICHSDWFGKNCDVFCAPRNDSSGHYSCNHANGAKECLTNWFGKNCDVYCAPSNVTSDQQCSFNNTLICARNWYGANCSVHCEPRDDNEAHYKCNQRTGQMICLPGWHGGKLFHLLYSS